MPDIPFKSAQRSPASSSARSPSDWSGIDPARAESAKKFGMSPDLLRKMDAIPDPPDAVQEKNGDPGPGANYPATGAPAPTPAANKPDDLYAPVSEDEKHAVDPMYAPITDEERKQLEPQKAEGPNLSALEFHFQNTLGGYFKKAATNVVGDLGGNFAAGMANPNPDTSPQKSADSFLEAVEAGLQLSVSGLYERGKKPDVVVPEDAPRVYKIASSLAQVAGDLPAMLPGGALGFVFGAAGGAAVGAPTGPGDLGFALAGGAMGTYAGANALPAALRKIMMDHYEKGDIKDKQDFWDRLSSTFLTTLKAGTVGALTAGAGKVAGAVAEPLAGPITTAAAKTVSEIATMVTVGKALEGQMPNADDFLVAAATVGAFHGVEAATAPVAAKMREIYAESGALPHEVAEEAQKNPVVLQELMADNVDIPAAYKSMEEAPAEKTHLIPEEQQKVDDLQAQIDSFKGRDLQPAEEKQLEALKARQEELTAGTKTIDPSPSIAEPSNVLSDGEKQQVGARIEALRGLRILGETGALGHDPNNLPARSDAAQRVIDQIVKRPEKEGYSFNQFYTDWVDRMDPLKRWEMQFTGGKAAETGDSPYLMARNLPGVSSLVSQAVKLGTFDYNTYEPTGKSFREIIEPFKKDPTMLEAALLAKRTVELARQGKENLPIALEDAKQVLKEAGGKYDSVAKDLVDYQNRVLKYLADSGILSKDGFNQMKELHQNYIPLYRLLDEEEASGAKGAGNGGAKNPLKRMSDKGSERPVIRPLESIVRNTEAFITLAERNRVGRAMADLAETRPELAEQVFKRVKTPMKAIDVKSPELMRMLNAHGIGVEGELPDSFSIFRPQALQLSDKEIAVFRDGKREVYEVPKEVGQALKGMDMPTANMFMRLMSFPARALRAGTVLQPAFGLRHFFRNQFTSWANTKEGYTPFAGALGAVGDLWNKSDAWQKWVKSGGSMGESQKIADFIDQDIYGLNKETGIIEKGFNVAKTPIDLLHALSESMDQVTRVGVWKKVAGENPSPADMRKAAYAARESSVDMTRAGMQARAVNQLIAFWNIGGIQGTDRFIRSFKENPIGFSAKMFAGVTVPSLLLWFANNRDEETKKVYKEIPQWEKNTYWHFVIDKDHAPIKLPKPFIEGVTFGTSVERMLDAFIAHDPKAMPELAKALALDHTPGFVPSAMGPAIEQFANKSVFTGSHIVPPNLADIAPQYQYTEYTTDTAKALGKIVSMVPGIGKTSFASPMVLENYARGWGGALGTYALQLADQFLHAGSDAASKAAGHDVGYPTPNLPTKTLAEMPFIKDFVTRFPSANAQSIQDFYEKLDETERFHKTIKHLSAIGDYEAVQKEISIDENQQLFQNLTGTREGLSNQSALIHKINRDATMPPDQKRQLIQGIYATMIDVATVANEQADAYAKAIRGEKQ